MKKKLLLIALVVSNSFNLFGQKIVENKIDEFTGVKKVSTDFELLKTSNKIYVRVRKIEDSYILSFKIITDEILSVSEKDELLFIAANDSVINLKNSEYTIACTGCGSNGILGSALSGLHLNFYLSNYQVSFLKRNEVKKWRLYTSRGYIEGVIKEKSADLIMTEIKIIDNLKS